ncbi:hypothetical protein LINPERPRIM_LOCUS40782 [Linum perenne]
MPTIALQTKPFLLPPHNNTGVLPLPRSRRPYTSHQSPTKTAPPPHPSLRIAEFPDYRLQEAASSCCCIIWNGKGLFG